MVRPLDPLQQLHDVQAAASGPQAHVWLSASAGTGKTHVLTARVLRLLLGGVHAEQILCLTFTKAGASEMAERIHGRLAAWVQMDGPELARDLMALGEDYGPDALEHARQLFASVLEATGGGLRIQTIHSFCQQLLASFPLEAGLVPGFRPLDEREQSDLARRTLSELVLGAEERGDHALIAALEALALRLGEERAEAFLLGAARAHDALAALPPDVRGWLFNALGLPEGNIEDVLALACSDAAFDMEAISRLIAAHEAWGTATGEKIAAALRAWRGEDERARAARLDDLKACVFTGKNEPRAAKPKLIEAEPDFEALQLRVGERCVQLLSLRDWVAYGETLAGALQAARAFSGAYEAAKRAVAAVDYDDLIAHAAALLRQPGMSDWIRYKLDQRTDHILVDEAQDTNERQWSIIGALADEYFAGEGARGDGPRTLFTVGDFKQAIFGFQGTSPRAFASAQERFRALADEGGYAFRSLSLDESFRSTPAVLEVVDATVAEIGPERLGLEAARVHHVSRRCYPGEVSLLRPVSLVPEEGSEDVGPEDTPEGEEDWLSDHQRLLAQKIAEEIKSWLDAGTMLESKGRPMRPGDIMILLRKRGDLARLIVARLHEAGVPVGGIDRLRLQAPLAVQDLVAALRFATQPEDDLNLASLLVSPLIGWSQEELMQRAAPRRDSLWRHLRGQGALPGMEALADILGCADFVTPYRMLERILSGPMRGRRALIARLGEEARDPIDELLQAALDFEANDTPGLQPFIDWFDRAQGDIKREDDGQGDVVRLLTVHGSKGLQAPVVILADAAANPNRPGARDRLDWTGPEGALPLIPPRATERMPALAAALETAQAEEREEHWRLLYVGMTRAEERLIVAGALGAREKGIVPEQSWHGAIGRAMQAMGAQAQEDARWGMRWVWRGSEALKPKAREKEEPETSEVVDRPAWIDQPAPQEARPPRPLAPSAAVEDKTPDPPPSPAQRAAARRGQCLHALFERLPDVPPDERRAAAARWLERSAGVEDAAERDAMIDHALAIFDDPRFSALFRPEALAEAPIAAVVGTEVIAGTVDRLLVEPERILLVDFKTGRQAPQDAGTVPEAHLRQMAAYVAVLEVIFPGRAVEAALLYTAGPSLVSLDPALLAPHKPGLPEGQESLAR